MALTIGAIAPTWADAPRDAVVQTVQFQIPTQSLASALSEFARQSGRQLLFAPNIVADKTANAVAGSFTPLTALDRLIAGTGLTYSLTNSGAILLRDPTRAAAADDGATSTQGEDQETKRPEEEASRPVERVVVTGSHIRGPKNGTAPVTILDRNYIDSTGISTTSRLIETLPQNFGLASQSGVQVPGVSSTAQGSAINLRGIGEGSTLTLLNGRRMASGFVGSAADISALPLSAIERVEVLTDGASAIYGSDAIGGVVNFVLRHDYDGAETRLRSGWAEGGVNEYQASQTIGRSWKSGNALVSAEFYQRDLLPASERDFVPSTSVVGSLFPRDKNQSVLLSGTQELNARLRLFADALYTHRDSFNMGGDKTFDESFTVTNPQISATGGLTWEAGGDWQVEASASYAKNTLDSTFHNSLFEAFGFGDFFFHNRFEVGAAQVKADGTVFELPGGDVRAAIGADWRSESFQSAQVFSSGLFPNHAAFSQTVRSAFVELSLPLVGDANAITAINRLKLSLAARYDDYSTFGSSIDPQVGILWEPVDGLRIRSSYGTSYKAPNLPDYDVSINGAQVISAADPSAAGGVSRILQLFGSDTSDYAPQEATSLSLGFDVTPLSIPGLQAGLNYYDIDYRDRIAAPGNGSFAVLLANPSSYASLITRVPTIAQVNQAIAFGRAGQGFRVDGAICDFTCTFDPASVEVIVDTRKRNLSVVKSNGLDIFAQYTLDGPVGDFNFGLSGTYILEKIEQVTSTSVPADKVGTFYNPPKLRIRGSASWHHQGWAANTFVNYADSYVDTRLPVAAAVSSYTTVDIRLAYDFGEQIKTGFWSGTTISVSAQNLFDRDPPRTAVLNPQADMGFDPTNANPMGRLVAIDFVKAW